MKILYFSATGNSRHVAERIAEPTGGSLISIVDCIRQGHYQFVDEVIGVVSPTFYYGLPSLVYDFLKKAEIKADYYFLVSTYGSSSTATVNIPGRKPDAIASVRMPNTWTPRFDLSTPEKVALFTTTTEEDIANTIAMVGNRVHGNQQRRKTSAILADGGSSQDFRSVGFHNPQNLKVLPRNVQQPLRGFVVSLQLETDGHARLQVIEK